MGRKEALETLESDLALAIAAEPTPGTTAWWLMRARALGLSWLRSAPEEPAVAEISYRDTLHRQKAPALLKAGEATEDALRSEA